MESSFTARGALIQALRQGPGYGRELAERVFAATKKRLPPGTVYPALEALRRAGLARAWKVVPGERRGGRSRTYYELTYRGLLRAQAEVLTFLRLGRPAPLRFKKPSPATLRARLSRVSDLIAFTEDLAIGRRLPK